MTLSADIAACGENPAFGRRNACFLQAPAAVEPRYSATFSDDVSVRGGHGLTRDALEWRILLRVSCMGKRGSTNAMEVMYPQVSEARSEYGIVFQPDTFGSGVRGPVGRERLVGIPVGRPDA